jgi:hypothetical protein
MTELFPGWLIGLTVMYAVLLWIEYRKGWAHRYEKWLRWPLCLVASGLGAVVFSSVLFAPENHLTYGGAWSVIDKTGMEIVVFQPDVDLWSWSNLAATLVVIGVSLAFVSIYFVVESRDRGQSLFQYMFALDDHKVMSTKAWQKSFSDARLFELQMFRRAALFDAYPVDYEQDMLESLLYRHPFPNDKHDVEKAEHMMRQSVDKVNYKSPYQQRKLVFLLPPHKIQDKGPHAMSLSVPGTTSEETKHISEQAQMQHVLSRMFEDVHALSIVSEWSRHAELTDSVACLAQLWILKTCWSQIAKRPIQQYSGSSAVKLDLEYWCQTIWRTWQDKINIHGTTRDKVNRELAKRNYSFTVFEPVVAALLNNLAQNIHEFKKTKAYQEFHRLMTLQMTRLPTSAVETLEHLEDDDPEEEEEDKQASDEEVKNEPTTRI